MATLSMQNNLTIDTSSLSAGDIINCPYDGIIHYIILYPGEYQLECWGAQGGSYNTSYATGGLGAYAKGVLNLIKPTILFLSPGGQGTYGTSSTTPSGGGFNGGGNATYRGGGGGGASDIRIEKNSLYARVIVAGGGGGAYSYSATYNADGGYSAENGANGDSYSTSYLFYGIGGTQTAGGSSNTAIASTSAYNGEDGSFGKGGNTGSCYSTSYYSNGAGGSGWYGGSAADNYNSSSRTRASGGGGGSSYTFNISTASNYPTGCLLNSSYYLTETSINTGTSSFTDYSGSTVTGHSGDGAIRITIKKINPMINKIYLKTDTSTWLQLFENTLPNISTPIVNVTFNGTSNQYGYITINGTKYTSSIANIETNQDIIFGVVACPYYGSNGQVILNGETIYTTSSTTAIPYSWSPIGYNTIDITFSTAGYYDTQINIITS